MPLTLGERYGIRYASPPHEAARKSASASRRKESRRLPTGTPLPVFDTARIFLLSVIEASGVRLFQRGARKIELTNEGILLRRRAEEILALVEKTERELALQEEQIEGVISIESGETAAVQTLAKACKAFSERHPRVQFDLYTANANHIREQIENGILDIGLLLEPMDMASFGFIRLTPKERGLTTL